MNTKKAVATILSVIMIITLLAACANEPEQPQEIPAQIEEPEQGQGQTQEAVTEPTVGVPDENAQTPPQANTSFPSNIEGIPIDFVSVFNKFPPDTVMFTTGDIDANWELFYIRIHMSVRSLFESMGMVPDFSEPTPEGRSYADMLMDFAVRATHQLKVAEFVAGELGVQLDEEELELMELYLQENILMSGGEDAMMEYLWENYGIRSIELFRELLTLEYFPMAIFRSQFGEMGEHLQDEELDLYFEDEDFIMAKHILRQRSDDDPDAAWAEIEEIYRLLRGYQGDDFEAFFDELMHEHTQDPGVWSFPSGYIFQTGDMVQPFYEASVALEIGAMSEIVETNHGYHIILRLPVDYDAPFMDGSVTLRTMAAFNKYEELMSNWVVELPPVFTAEFESINWAQLFEPCRIF